MKKTLLQINSVANHGSTGKIAEDLGKTATKYGYESFIAYAREAKLSSSNLIKIGNTFDYYIHALSSRITDRAGFYSKKATEQFIKELKEIKPNVIHLHNLHGYYINIEQLFTYIKEYNIATVWTLHDCWAFTGHCPHFEYVGCNKWKTHCYGCPQKTSYPSSYVFDNSRKNFEDKKRLFQGVKNMTIVPVSNWLADLVKESFLGEYDIKVIHNGVNIEKFKPINIEEKIKIKSNLLKKYSIENANNIILGVTSIWGKSKGLYDFIEISESIDKDTKILLVGVNDRLKRKLPKNIIGISRTENIEELAKFYSIADIFANPTYADTFPTTNLEALACGTPVVTYDVGGSPESLDENTGFVVQKGDKTALLNAFNTVISNGKSMYQEACVKKARNNFVNAKNYLKYIEIYKEMID